MAPKVLLCRGIQKNDVCKSPKTKHGFKLKTIFEFEMAYNAPGLGCIQVFQTLFRLARCYEIIDSWTLLVHCMLQSVPKTVPVVLILRNVRFLNTFSSLYAPKCSKNLTDRVWIPQNSKFLDALVHGMVKVFQKWSRYDFVTVPARDWLTSISGLLYTIAPSGQ